MENQVESELQKNMQYVQNHIDELLKTYPNKYLLVVNEKVVNSFDDYAHAANYGIQNYGIDSNLYIEFLNTQQLINFIFTANL